MLMTIVASIISLGVGALIGMGIVLAGDRFESYCEGDDGD